MTKVLKLQDCVQRGGLDPKPRRLTLGWPDSPFVAQSSFHLLGETFN